MPIAMTPQLSTSKSSDGGTVISHGTVTADVRWSRIERKLVAEFTPAYFVTIMGTGISSCILYKFPYPARWLQICGIIMWSIGIFFFLSTTTCFVVSSCKYRENWKKFHYDPKVAVFMGCFPMGYTTLVNFLYYLTGDSWIIGIYVLWWISVALSLYTACCVFFFALIGKRKDQAKDFAHSDLHATLLLPIVTLTVAVSSGGIMTQDLPSLDLKILTMVVCYVLWAIAIVLAFAIITVHMWKLFVHKIPSTAHVFTSFLPIGVLGQGAFGIILLGKNFHDTIANNSQHLITSHYLSYEDPSLFTNPDSVRILTLALSNIVLIACTMMSLFLTSFGYFWTFIAVSSVLSKISPFASSHDKSATYWPAEGCSSWKKLFRGLIKYNKSFWAMTFPLGTMSLSNTQLAKIYANFGAFRVVGAIYGVALILITCGCIFGVVFQSYRWVKTELMAPDSIQKEIESV